MRLTFILPCHDVEEFLPESLGSVLGQEAEGVDLRVLAVDDASPDGSGHLRIAANGVARDAKRSSCRKRALPGPIPV